MKRSWLPASFFFFCRSHPVNTNIYFFCCLLAFSAALSTLLFEYSGGSLNLSRFPSIYAFSYATNVESVSMLLFFFHVLFDFRQFSVVSSMHLLQ